MNSTQHGADSLKNIASRVLRGKHAARPRPAAAARRCTGARRGCLAMVDFPPLQS